jgi:hypothetical protein
VLVIHLNTEKPEGDAGDRVAPDVLGGTVDGAGATAVG